MNCQKINAEQCQFDLEKIVAVLVDYWGVQPKRIGIIAFNRWQSIT